MPNYPSYMGYPTYGMYDNSQIQYNSPNPYNNPYYPNQNQYYPNANNSQQQMMAQNKPSVFPLVFVKSFKEANDYIVNPNNGIYLLDIQNKMFYEKTADSLGKYTLTPFSLANIELDQSGNVITHNDNKQNDNHNFATREDFKGLASKSDLKALENAFDSKLDKLSALIENSLRKPNKGNNERNN